MNEEESNNLADLDRAEIYRCAPGRLTELLDELARLLANQTKNYRLEE